MDGTVKIWDCKTCEYETCMLNPKYWGDSRIVDAVACKKEAALSDRIVWRVPNDQ